MLASKGGELKTVNALITAGVDANHVNEVSGAVYTSLYTSRPFCEPITVALHMSVITQDGDSPLMMAASNGRTEVVALLVKAGANTDLQNKVSCMGGYGSSTVLWSVHHNVMMVYEVMHCVCLSSPGWILCTDDGCQQLE